jgi:hypothetical protein
MSLQWIICLILTLGGAITALVEGFVYLSIKGVVVGIVIALIGLWFRPRGKQ